MPNSPEDPADYPWDLVLHRGFRGKPPLPPGWPRNPHLEYQLNRVRSAMTPDEYDEWLPGFLQRLLDRDAAEASKRPSTLPQRGTGRSALVVRAQKEPKPAVTHDVPADQGKVRASNASRPAVGILSPEDKRQAHPNQPLQSFYRDGILSDVNSRHRAATDNKVANTRSARAPLGTFESGATLQAALNDRDYMEGRISQEELVQRRNAQAIGAAIGAAPYAVGAAVVGAGALAKNVDIDGPSKGMRYGKGRIVGVRWKKGDAGARLDYHKINKLGPEPVLHINYGRPYNKEGEHIILYNPNRKRRP